jgi:hypothetical protein
VGTHNHGHTAEQIVDGILEIVKACHEKQPQAEVIVMVRLLLTFSRVIKLHHFTAGCFFMFMPLIPNNI